MRTTNKKALEFKKILGVKICSTPKKRVLDYIKSSLEQRKKIFIVTPNPEQLVLANEDSNFLQALNQASLAIPDGVGLVWASKILNKTIPERISGADLMLDLCKMAGEHGWRVFLLGGRPGVAQIAAEKLAESLKLQTIFEEGTQDIRQETEEQRQRIIQKINQSQARLLFVAFGAPYQEFWLHQNWSALNVNVVMVVGGALDYLSGRIKRSPRVLQRIGLEWLWRLLHEPWRIKRQIKLLKFIWLVLKEMTNG